MHLLRGFGKQVNTESLVLARTDAEKSLDTLRGEAIGVIEQAEVHAPRVDANAR